MMIKEEVFGTGINKYSRLDTMAIAAGRTGGEKAGHCALCIGLSFWLLFISGRDLRGRHTWLLHACNILIPAI